jgi:serine/threonine-protein kinase
VKILDLGLALAGGGDDDGSLTREHDETVLGTADYLAPEQATDSHKADRRSDIYSLGCTLYFLLAGKPPFASGTLSERIKSHVRKPPPNLLDERTDVPVAIAELYFRMLEKHPDARPQSAQEVADALGAWLAATSTEASSGRPEAVRRSLPRRTTSAGGDSGAHTAVVRSGPGSAGPSSISFGRQGAGSGVLPAASTPAPPRPARPVAAPPRASAAPTISIDVGRPATSAADGKGDRSGAEEPAKRRARKPLQFAGLPLGYWIIAAVGLVLTAVLGFMVWQKFG